MRSTYTRVNTVMTYYAFHARDFLTQTRMADGDDIRKACDKIFRYI